MFFTDIDLFLKRACSGQSNKPGDARLVEKKQERPEPMPKGQQQGEGDWELIFPSKREFNNSYLQAMIGVLGSESKV